MDNLRASRMLHARRRALERYGVALTRGDIVRIESRIRLGSAKLVRSGVVPGREVWDVECQGELLRAVWSVAHQHVITFLTRRMGVHPERQRRKKPRRRKWKPDSREMKREYGRLGKKLRRRPPECDDDEI